MSFHGSTSGQAWLRSSDAPCCLACLKRTRNLKKHWPGTKASAWDLPERFVETVVDTVEAIAAAPMHYAVVENGRRRAGVRRFPYGLFFLVEETRIVVIVRWQTGQSMPGSSSSRSMEVGVTYRWWTSGGRCPQHQCAAGLGRRRKKSDTNQHGGAMQHVRMSGAGYRRKTGCPASPEGQCESVADF